MCSTKKVLKVLVACLILAKFSEAVPKKYDSQAEGSNATNNALQSHTNNNTFPCLANCGEWRVLSHSEAKVPLIPSPSILSTYSNNDGNTGNSFTPMVYPNQAFSSTSTTVNRIALPKSSFISSSTYPENPWRRNFQKDKLNETYIDNASDRTQRLGYSTGLGSSSNYGGYSGGSSLQGYGYSGSGISAYPYKVDLGGVVLGAIVGIGALILIPKVLGVIAGGNPGYGYGAYRNIDELNGVTDMVTKLDEFLAKNNVDSTACMQKAVCHYIRNSSQHSSSGTANQVEEMILALSENSVVEYMIDGTAIKEALTNGRNGSGRDCDAIYANCPLDRDGAMQLAKKFLPFGRT